MLHRPFILVLIFAVSIVISPETRSEVTVKPISVNPKVYNLNDVVSILENYHRDSSCIDRSIEVLKIMIIEQPNNVEAINFLSRVWLTYGYAKARTKEDMIMAFGNGVEAAEKALAIAPENPDSHFFYVANLASLGDVKGVFNSLFMLPEIRHELEIILDLDPNHPYGLAMNGALYSYLPGILGGDTEIADIYIRRAIKIEPHVSSTKLYLARNLRKQKKYGEAIEVLHELVNDKEPAFYPDWYLNRRYAVYLMSQIRQEKN